MSDNNAPQTKFDVFVSFRGQDIRKGFLSHLTDAFHRKKIHAFVDDKLERGGEIWPSLVGAIEGSAISVIIFSKHYASSRWCLEELVTILECRERYKRIVIPVFYGVDPTVVRHQKGSYKNAFSRHGRRYKTKVESWTHALNKSANLSGLESSNFQNDAELIKAIVKLVLMRLGEPSINTRELIGIDKKIAHVESLICLEREGTHVIGIWGMGGIGKTTIAEELFDRLKSKYEGCYFLHNEREKSKKQGIISLKKCIFSQLLGDDVKIDTSNGLSNDIVRRMGRMKVLIVLDDVNDSEHLEKIIGTPNYFGSGSRIIVTTRDKQVLIASKIVDIYQVERLSSSEALELFNLNVFIGDLQMEYDELSNRVVNYAKGNPLVLKVICCLLCGRDKNVWESLLDSLKKEANKDVYKVMRLSYDDLGRKEKQIFLDLACFFLGLNVKVGYLKSLLKDSESDNSVAYGLERLKDRALITFSMDNCASMHDSIQEVGWEIVRQEPSRSRLWDPDDAHEVLKSDKDIEAIRSIRIPLSTFRMQKLSPRIFEKMNKLQFLDFSGRYNQDCFDQDCFHLLAEGLKFLSTKLRYLSWYFYPLESFPENFSAEKLVILKLQNSKIEKLWHEVKNLPNLKEVDLSLSENLEELPDFSSATNLEVLILHFCKKLTSLHPSIFSLVKLKILYLSGCTSLQTLPKLPFFLDRLNVSNCKSLKILPELPPSLSYLDASNYTPLQALPELPPSPEILPVEHCTSLQTLL